MTDRSEMFDKLKGLIERFNKKGVELSDATTFVGQLVDAVLKLTE